uniref:Peptidase M13 N-terminal domain-containing protein n=1 Tax=Panagrellus redivivus TaxID=6233 RepID=A0A7E4ZSB6_PANRE
MLFYFGLLLALFLASCDANVQNIDGIFVPKPIPTKSQYNYVKHLAECKKTFHSLVENCGSGKKNCPILTDQTPPKYVSDSIQWSNATTMKKLMAFFKYNIDQEITNANGYNLDTGINFLHPTDFDLATNHVWKCTRLNYRHLYHYEFATTDEIEKQMSFNEDTLSDFYINPTDYYTDLKVDYNNPTVSLTRDAITKAINEPVPWTPMKAIYVDSAVEEHFTSDTGFDVIPFSKFYLFKSFVQNMRLAYAAKEILTGNRLVNHINANFEEIKTDPAVPKVMKAQMKQFINSVTSKWAQTKDIRQYSIDTGMTSTSLS